MMTTAEDFNSRHSRIVDCYRDVVDFAADSNKFLTMNLIEACDDLDFCGEIIGSICSAKLPSVEFRRAASKLHGSLWHLIHHLQDLNENLATILESDPE